MTSPVLRLEVLMDPVPKARPRFNRATGTAFTPKTTMRAESAIRAAWQEAGAVRLPAVPLVLRVVMLFARPDSHCLKDGSLSAAGRGAIPGGVKDWDNLAKTVSDALNKCAWPDDRFFVDVQVIKDWAVRGESPSIEIRAWEAV